MYGPIDLHICIHLCNHHPDQDTEQFLCPRTAFISITFPKLSSPPAVVGALSVRCDSLGNRVWSFKECERKGTEKSKPCGAKVGGEGVFLLKYMSGFKEKLKQPV